MDQQNAPKAENSKQEKSKSKQPPKLKSFEIVQKNFATAGITPNLANQTYPLNGTILFEFLMLSTGIYSTTVFIIYDAGTLIEYTQSVYIDSLLILIILSLLIIILKAAKLFEYIGGNDNLINNSKWECQTNFYYPDESFLLKLYIFATVICFPLRVLHIK